MAGLIDVIESDFFPFVGKVAPLLATVLGSPLAGVGINLIADAFGVKSKSIDAISKAISIDPEAALKLKTIEYEHAELLAKISSSDYATEVNDREDARKNSQLFKDFLRHMAYFITFGFFGALFLLFLPLNISGEEKNLLSLLVGMLASKWQTIVDFFYGSSRNSNNTQGVTK